MRLSGGKRLRPVKETVKATSSGACDVHNLLWTPDGIADRPCDARGFLLPFRAARYARTEEGSGAAALLDMLRGRRAGMGR